MTPRPLSITPYMLAERFVGMGEISGPKNNPFILWAHGLCDIKEATDEIPWCSSFLNAIFWQLRLWRSKSARARSWLAGGMPITLAEAAPGFDVVVFQRGAGAQPGPDVLDAPGHVALFAGFDRDVVLALGGNQGDQVSIGRFAQDRVLGVRRVTR
jgi:uncharacterized protein (TIGR02594 family)